MRRAYALLLVCLPCFASDSVESQQAKKFADEMARCSAMNDSFALASGDASLVNGSRHYSERYIGAARTSAGEKYVSEQASNIQAQVQRDFVSFLASQQSQQTFDLMTPWQDLLIRCNAEADAGKASLGSNKSFKPKPLRGSA